VDAAGRDKQCIRKESGLVGGPDGT